MRKPDLQTLIDRLTAAFAQAGVSPPARKALDLIFARLATPAPAAAVIPVQPEVTAHLPVALAPLLTRADALAALAQAFATLAPALSWGPRKAGGPHASPDFASSHANAMLIGPGGLEARDDVWIGVSLMAPHTRYPDHTHPPEEVYIALTDGAFLQTGTWTEVAPGDTIYNTPGITHAMRAGERPFLAIWCLPI